MGQKSKLLVTSEGNFDLSTYTWDDQLFTDILIRENPIDSAQAMGISRSLREDISKLEITTIPVSFIEKMIEAKLMEFGLTKPSPIHLDKSIFVKNRLNLSENAIRVLKRRYLRKNRKGNVIETPEQMFRRVAQHIAKAEKNYGNKSIEAINRCEEIFFDMMADAKFLPNSPTLMNAGRPLGQLAACFVLPVEDSMEGIFGALHHAALDPQIRWRDRLRIFPAASEKQRGGDHRRRGFGSGIVYEDF